MPNYTLVRCQSCMAELGKSCRNARYLNPGTHPVRKELYWARYHNKQLRPISV